MRDRTKDPRFKNLTGHTYNRWTVLEYAGTTGVGRCQPSLWKCRCECGQIRNVVGTTLTNGSSKSCGCLSAESIAERSTKHGHAKRRDMHELYGTWTGIIARCENTNSPRYSDYGGRGVSICDRWRKSFADFLSDVGERPSKKHSLDRYPDKNGNYEPGNVRWATDTEQAQNKRCNVNLTIGDITLCVAEWSRRFGVAHGIIKQRLRNGWSPERAVKTKPRAMRSQVFTAHGETMSLAEWSKRLGVRYQTLWDRIHTSGINPEDALTSDLQSTPFRSLVRGN